MKKIIYILLTALLSLTLIGAKAQETPPSGLKSVNAQFYINLADSSVWQNKGIPYGWQRIARYKDIKNFVTKTQFQEAKDSLVNLYTAQTIHGKKNFTDTIMVKSLTSDGSIGAPTVFSNAYYGIDYSFANSFAASSEVHLRATTLPPGNFYHQYLQAKDGYIALTTDIPTTGHLDSAYAKKDSVIQNQDAVTQNAKFKISGDGQANIFIAGVPDDSNYALLSPDEITLLNSYGSASLASGGLAIHNADPAIPNTSRNFTTVLASGKVQLIADADAPIEVSRLQSIYTPIAPNDVIRLQDANTITQKNDSTFINKNSISAAIPGNYLGGYQTTMFSSSVSGWDQTLGEQGNIIKVGNLYIMIYTGFTPPYTQTSTYAGIATSTDGVTFTREGTVGDGQIIPTVALEDPYIIYNPANSTYYLYAEDKSVDPFKNIRCFTSTDRLSWTDRGTILDIGGVGTWDSKDVSSPTVRLEGGIFYLFYEGRQTGASQYGAVGLATSTDGFTFTKNGSNPLVTGNFFANPTFAYAYACVPDDIIKIGDTYLMSTHNLVNNNTVFAAGLAVSKDLIHWTDKLGSFLQKSDGFDGTGDGMMFIDNGKQILPLYQSADNKTLYLSNFQTKADYNIGGKPLTTTGPVTAGSVASATSVTGDTGTFTGNLSADNYTISGTPSTWSLSSGNYMLVRDASTKKIFQADLQTLGIINSNFNSNALQVNAKFNVMTGTFTGGSGIFTANGNQLTFSRAGANFIDAQTAGGTVGFRGTNTTSGDVPYMTFSNSGTAVTYNMPGLTASRIMSTDASRNITMLSQIGVTQGGTGTQTAPTIGQILVATSTSVYTPTTPTGTGAPVFSASPTLTGIPTAPTAAPGTNTTQIQTTAGTVAERTAAATLTNKTLTTPKLTGYTVATLPSGTIGMLAYVTDALTPTFLVVVVGGGSVVAPVFYNGTNWVSY